MMKRNLVAIAINGMILATLLLLVGNTELKAQVVVPGYNAPDEQLGGVRYRSLKNTGGDEIYIGIPDLGIGANRAQRQMTWAQGVNQIVFTYDPNNDKLSTTVTNGNGSYLLEYSNFSTQLIAKGRINPPSKMNVMQITVSDRTAGSTVAFNNVILDGTPLGNFAMPGQFADWMVENYDFGAGFTLTGEVVLSGSFSDSQELSRVELKIGVRNAAPTCQAAIPSVETIWAPNHQFVPVGILGVVDPEGTPVTVIVTSIRQDEPVNSEGDGNSEPDGTGVGTSVASVRAERAGGGNGRVYTIRFTASDAGGKSCTGLVTAGVPANQGKNSSPVDDGDNYDSTVPNP